MPTITITYPPILRPGGSNQTLTKYLTRLFLLSLSSSVIIGCSAKFLRAKPVLLGTVLIVTVSAFGLWLLLDPLVAFEENQPVGVQFWLAIMLSFATDVAFVVATRKLLRRAAEMNSFAKILAVIMFNLLLALFVISPLPLGGSLDEYTQGGSFGESVALTLMLLGVSNLLDAALALIFFLLALLLLTHRLLWPLLNRTVFRLQEIGTKGRRSILATTGFALLTTSAFGHKVPDLVKDIIKTLAG